MAKNKTEIHVTTVFDGELDATDVFVSLISQKYGKTNSKEYLAKKKDLKYNEDEVQKLSLIHILDGSLELDSADKFYISNEANLELQIGDFVEISYNGEIMDSYPCLLYTSRCV